MKLHIAHELLESQHTSSRHFTHSIGDLGGGKNSSDDFAAGKKHLGTKKQAVLFSQLAEVLFAAKSSVLCCSLLCSKHTQLEESQHTILHTQMMILLRKKPPQMILLRKQTRVWHCLHKKAGRCRRNQDNFWLQKLKSFIALQKILIGTVL